MNLKLLLTPIILLGLCCCGIAQKGKIESSPPLNNIIVSHDTILSMSSCAGKALFPISRPLLWGERLMMRLSRGSVLASRRIDPNGKTFIFHSECLTAQPDGVPHELPCKRCLLSLPISMFSVQRGTSASAPTPGPARTASRPEPSAAGAKTLYVNRSFQPSRLLTSAVWWSLDDISRAAKPACWIVLFSDLRAS